MIKMDKIPFCLPCDVREEVYSKPPTYKHVQTLQYDPSNRPRKVKPPGTDLCECTERCGESCFNRLVYTECYGDASKDKNSSNCRLGPDCGNRQVAQRKTTACKPQREHGKGWALVANAKAPKGSFIQEYVGEVIDAKEKDRRLQDWEREHPNDPNFYIMALTKGWFIDAREVANLSRFINHSCDPNCILIPENEAGYTRNAIIATKDIEPGDYLSYDYRFDTRQGDRFVCRCGAPNCRGTMKEGATLFDGKEFHKSEKLSWEEAKRAYVRDEKLIADYESHQKMLAKVRETLPGSDEDLVSAGPHTSHRDAVISNRIFLWRNVVVGCRFERRCE